MTKGKRKRQQVFKTAGVTPSPFGGRLGGGASLFSPPRGERGEGPFLILWSAQDGYSDRSSGRSRTCAHSYYRSPGTTRHSGRPS